MSAPTLAREVAGQACRCCGRPMAARPGPCPPGAVRHIARGLCDACHRAARLAGSLADHPRRTWSRDELLDEWVILRGQGLTLRQAADRLGMTRAAFDRALTRARRAGDERARL